MASQDTAKSNVGFHQRDHDILSLLSIFIHSYRSLTTGLLLSELLIDEHNFDLPAPLNEGAYFEVYSVTSRTLLEACSPHDLPGAHIEALPEIVAVKCPKIKGDLRDKRNQKLWSSMAMELQILKHDYIQNHENIVNVLGVCWRSAEEWIMPAFVMEAAHTNLHAMIQSEGFVISRVSTRKIFGLAIDVSAGVSALHTVGIIHGDIKPNNVLIFKDSGLGFVAKISDFGSSLLKTDVKEPIVLPFSTGVWQAPECRQALDGEQLAKADAYSLALLVSHILSRGYMLELLENGDPSERITTGTDPYSFAQTSSCIALGSVVKGALEAEEEKRYGPLAVQRSAASQNRDDEDEDDTGQIQSIDQITRGVIEAVLPILLEPSIRPNSRSLHRNLRICLSWIVYRDMLNPLNYADQSRISDLIRETQTNSQEHDVIQNPGDEAPTEEDKTRVWQYATMTEYIERSFDAICEGKGVPTLEDIPRAEAAHRIQRTLRNWQKHELPKPEEIYQLRDAGAVVEADRSFGTLQILPPVVRDQIVTELKAVAYDSNENKPRRAEAAWQCSVLQFRLMQMDKDNERKYDSMLQLMLLAARLDHTEAGGLVGWLHSVFDQPLLVSMQDELRWLYAAVCKGSSTARRRLYAVDIDKYSLAISHLRTRNAGIGLPVPRNYFDTEWYDDDDFLIAIEDSPNLTANVFQLAATGGRCRLLRQIVEQRDYKLRINDVYEGNETVLLKACRSGHIEIALYLLDNGADPTINNDEGVTPLHFLSSFNDDDIPMVADRLVQARADRESRTHKAHRYRNCLDSRYGVIDGTPLAWAVAASSEAATQALMDVGADPFDLQGKIVEYEEGWSNNAHTSPVWLAVMTCQYRLLDILLEYSQDCAAQLNSIDRKYGLKGLKDPFAMLGWLVTDRTASNFNRILIHGKEYGKAFQKTFQILVRYGADPFDIDGNGQSIMSPALDCIQPYIAEYLMSWQGGRLEPDGCLWIRNLLVACSRKDSISIKILFRYSQASKVSTEQWSAFFGSANGLPNDTEFLNRFEQYRDPRADLFPHFERALVAGKYNLARFIYNTGKCDVTVMSDGKTILGRLIVSAKAYSNSLRHIEAFLDLDVPDAVFYNVFDLEGTKMTALQAAVYLQEYRPGSSPTTFPIQSIIRRKYDREYLNLVVAEGPFKGKAAIHLAVDTCNPDAIRCLVEEEGDSLDLGLLDRKGNSVIDLASFLLRNQKQELEFWEVPEEQRKAADLRHFEKTMEILHMLYQTKRAGPRRILVSVSRIEVDELFVLLYEPEKFVTVKIKISMLDGLTPDLKARMGVWYSSKTNWDMTLIWPDIVERGPKLELNSSYFLFRSDGMSAKEIEDLGSKGHVLGSGDPRSGPDGEHSQVLNSIQNLMQQLEVEYSGAPQAD